MRKAIQKASKYLKDQLKWHVYPKWTRLKKKVTQSKATVKISGKYNAIKRFKSTRNSYLIIKGDKNNLIIDESVDFQSVNIEIYGNNNKIEISSSVKIDNVKIYVWGDDCTVTIGTGSYISSAVCIVGENKTHLKIGNNCMIGSGVEIRTTDSHGIFDIESHGKINNSKDVSVGSHVWIANQVLLLKGSMIPNGCVVGARSVVTGKLIEKDAVYAGNPARIIKQNVIWGWHTHRFPHREEISL